MCVYSVIMHLRRKVQKRVKHSATPHIPAFPSYIHYKRTRFVFYFLNKFLIYGCLKRVFKKIQKYN